MNAALSDLDQETQALEDILREDFAERWRGTTGKTIHLVDPQEDLTLNPALQRLRGLSSQGPR